ncbi:uncharacterized protein N7498_010022 [Penicillium cinerascens]|uniref:Uncharacterized protein n=1 Tax=Penicillium cinerascens TaxID=70096 RepID=A0A9W9J7L0_9EURO|nr:uncharacterized protein N7498_010022 [Penicillium cinerascens]KAJ5191037.1 hypothetical protein N7498_010022 [Penicillium cinerascens]
MTDTATITTLGIGIATLLFYVLPIIHRIVLRIWEFIKRGGKRDDLEQGVPIRIPPIESYPSPLPLFAPQARKRTPYTFHGKT